MRDGLEAEGFVCQRFRWSGHNSHRARTRAAQQLAAQICEQQNEQPEVRQAMWRTAMAGTSRFMPYGACARHRTGVATPSHLSRW